MFKVLQIVESDYFEQERRENQEKALREKVLIERKEEIDAAAAKRKYVISIFFHASALKFVFS